MVQHTDGPADLRRDERGQVERKVLAALCIGGLDPQARAGILRRLAEHKFAELDHEVVYRALAAIPANDPGDLRKSLARGVTRLGFPDIDVDSFFDAPAPGAEEIAVLLGQLSSRS